MGKANKSHRCVCVRERKSVGERVRGRALQVRYSRHVRLRLEGVSAGTPMTLRGRWLDGMAALGIGGVFRVSAWGVDYGELWFVTMRRGRRCH